MGLRENIDWGEAENGDPPWDFPAGNSYGLRPVNIVFRGEYWFYFISCHQESTNQFGVSQWSYNNGQYYILGEIN